MMMRIAAIALCCLGGAPSSFAVLPTGTASLVEINSTTRIITLELGEDIAYLKIYANLRPSGRMLGSTAALFDSHGEASGNEQLVFADRNGLPAGVYTLGPYVPVGAGIGIYYAPVGATVPTGLVGFGGSIHSDPALASAGFKYRPATGDLTLSIRAANIGVVGLQYAQQTEFDLSKLNHQSALGSPTQQNMNVVAFYNQMGLPMGEFNLGPVLPRGLDAFDLAIRYDTGYVRQGEPEVTPAIQIVPEPKTLLLFVVGVMIFARRQVAVRVIPGDSE